MTKSIDFYFDFISPYSYLAFKKIKNLNKTNTVNINYIPILLGGLHKLGGITAPAFNERKMKNMKNDCELVALKNNIIFKWNTKFPINTLNLMRGYLAINDQIKKKYFEICFDAYWRDNLDISNDKEVQKILELCKLNSKKFFENIKDQKIKDKLKNLTDIAFNNDIFGAPTFVVNKKIYWGQDRLDYALEEYYS
jgi:2-hydroxychromene-2-carboxylate isomerase